MILEELIKMKLSEKFVSHGWEGLITNLIPPSKEADVALPRILAFLKLIDLPFLIVPKDDPP